jgi:5-methylcytosine-specific restriction protein A
LVVVATDLDHIIPHKGDKDAFWVRSNWQGLCRSCHSRKTAAEDGGWGNAVRQGAENPGK